MGRAIKVQTGYGTLAQRDEISTTYSENANALTATDARGNVTTYEYDRFDRLYRTRFPSSSGASSTTDFEQLSYDTGGNVIERRLRDGQSIILAYDALGRLQTRNLPGSEPDVSYGYDNLGHTTSVAHSGQSLQFGYDALGRLRTQTGPHGTLTSALDAAGRRTGLTWPDKFSVEYDYLFTGELTAVKESGVTSGLGLLATYSYDNLGRRTTLTRGKGTTTGYSYDGTSRLAQLTQNLSATAADQTVGMSYNPAGQISTRTSSNDAYAWTQNQPVLRSYTVGSLNQYTAIDGVVPGYDARGNLTNLGAGAYTYTSENLLTSAPGGASLSYDPLGHLYQTSAASVTTRFAYDGDRLVAEYNASNQLMRRYVHGASVDEPLVWYEGAGTSTRRWLHADERGSIVAISDACGARYAINRYDEHGVPAATNAGRFQFTGQAWVPELQLYYFKARFYSASLGRFMQTDPIGYGAGMNMYAYVRGDAINWRDPSGLDGEILAWVTSTAQRDWERELELLMTWMQGFWDVRMPLLQVDKADAGAQSNEGTCFNAALGVGLAAQAPLPVIFSGPGISGGTSTGVSYGGSLLDTSLFLQVQANLMVSAGAFLGVGLSGQYGGGAVPAGINTTNVVHIEGNLGAAVSGGFTVDIPLDGSGTAIGGAADRIRLFKAGAGVGAALGVGVGTMTTIGTPTLRDLLRHIGVLDQRSTAATCRP